MARIAFGRKRSRLCQHRGDIVPHPPDEIGFCCTNSWIQAAADYFGGIERSGATSLIKNDAKGVSR